MTDFQTADAGIMAALHSISRIRGLLHQFEVALTAGHPIKAAGPGGYLYRRALDLSLRSLATAWNQELASVPIGAPERTPEVKPAVTPKEDFRSWGG